MARALFDGPTHMCTLVALRELSEFKQNITEQCRKLCGKSGDGDMVGFEEEEVEVYLLKGH